MDINIVGLDKPQLLLALYLGSHAQGMSHLGAPAQPMSLKTCTEVIEDRLRLNSSRPNALYFDYFYDHVLKVNISGESLNPDLYDRDNYEGAAADVVHQLRLREMEMEQDEQS